VIEATNLLSYTYDVKKQEHYQSWGHIYLLDDDFKLRSFKYRKATPKWGGFLICINSL